ncbi:unnamed protein product [Ceratitis capitata]|uniref:(Mediterranean fruit fly) hypothetical protein n=1 Tax=Ceratitis capitata TaxID=7213 RepID=A0A811U929_CERCA|nr:unnamed protein product [Ceratitis capitata]
MFNNLDVVYQDSNPGRQTPIPIKLLTIYFPPPLACFSNLQYKECDRISRQSRQPKTNLPLQHTPEFIIMSNRATERQSNTSSAYSEAKLPTSSGRVGGRCRVASGKCSHLHFSTFTFASALKQAHEQIDKRDKLPNQPNMVRDEDVMESVVYSNSSAG